MKPAIHVEGPSARPPRAWPIFLAVVALLVGLVLPVAIELLHDPHGAVGPFQRRSTGACVCREVK